MRYDPVTTGRCQQCSATFLPRGRQRFCSGACRQRAYRRRVAEPRGALLRESSLPIVYECGSCGSRLLGDWRCPDCNTFCRRLGPGGLCPHCDEPIVLAELA